MKTTPVFDRLAANHGKRFSILQGGTSSSKTYSVLQYLYCLASQCTEKLVISVVGETGPSLARGALRDWMEIICDCYHPSMHNKTTDTFILGKSMVEFFSIDQPQKARGSRRDILFMNEANNMPRRLYDQMEPRTRMKVILDYNPVEHFWAHELMQQMPDDEFWFDISTYRDNPFLEPSIIKAIESRRSSNPNWFKVFGLGQVGMREGRIIPDFELIDAMPDIATEVGIDFGFTNDNTVVLESGIKGDSIYVNELMYGLGLTNQDIAAGMKEKGVPADYTIYGDSAEPKSIEEIRREGFRGMRPCFKSEDGFRIGVDYILRYKVKVTKKSAGVIKDYRNACWDMDLDGKPTNKPAKGFLNSIDATRYSLSSYFKPAGSTRGGNI